MDIYDNIKNPIDTDEGLKKIVDAYLGDGKNKGSFYSRAVVYGEKNQEFNEEEFYKFQDIINEKELNILRNRKDVKDIKKYALLTKRFKNEDLNYIIESIPIVGDKLKKIRYNYPDYSYYKILEKYSNKDILQKYNEINEKLETDNVKLSKDEIKILKLINGYFYRRHNFIGLAGYHAYADELEEEFSEEDVGDTHYKIYLNLNYDQLYKFAAKYMELAKEEGIPYTFKVLTPLHDRPNRSEKICIYCNENNFYKNIDLVREIKNANPELKFGNPPIMAGVLDGWMGIGSDGYAYGESYNSVRSECIENALDKYFDGVSNTEAREMLENNPEILKEIRNAINKEAEQMRIVDDKFCFTQTGNEKIKRKGMKHQKTEFKFDKSRLRIEGLKSETSKGKNNVKEKASDNKVNVEEKEITSKKVEKNEDKNFEKYVELRQAHGKDSKQVKDLFEEIANLRAEDLINQKRKYKRRDSKEYILNVVSIEEIDDKEIVK